MSRTKNKHDLVSEFVRKGRCGQRARAVASSRPKSVSVSCRSCTNSTLVRIAQVLCSASEGMVVPSDLFARELANERQ